MSANMRAGVLAASAVLAAGVLAAPRLEAASVWGAVGALHSLRGEAAVAVLPDGRVLAAGGWDYAQGSVASAELYDPATGQWSLTAPMSTPRRFAAAVPLADGRVLVVGGEGQNGSSTLASAEVFDPATSTWQSVPSMQHERATPAAVRLQDGRVLVVGGGAGGVMDSVPVPAEVFDPSTASWTLAGLPHKARMDGTATLLPDGRVLVAGGRQAGGAPVGAEIYDPATHAWTQTGPLVVERIAHSTLLLPDGRVVMLGGLSANGRFEDTAETFDPATNTWTAVGWLPQPRYSHAALLTEDGRVMLIAGSVGPAGAYSYDGVPSASVDVFDPVSGQSSSGPALLQSRYGHSAVRLPDGAVLVLGGQRITCERLASENPGDAPPQVWLTEPLDGSMASGDVTLSALATDDYGVLRVDFYDGEARIGSVATPPYSMVWGAAQMAAGEHALRAIAYDTAYNPATSAPAHLTVVDVTPPQVSLTAPVDGATVRGVVTITADASDASGIARVEFSMDSYPIGVATQVPYSVTWDASSALIGNHSLIAVAFDAAGNVASTSPLTLSVPNDSTEIRYDPQLGAPRCLAGPAVCDSGDLLLGRGTVGPEPNQPNTIGGSCHDGTAGAFHSDESVDRIRISTLDGTPLAPGKTVQLEVSVWAWLGYGSDALDLFYAADARNPQWVALGRLIPTGAGLQVLSTRYVLPEGPLQAVRARFSYNSAATDACVEGSYDDHDDLVFAAEGGRRVEAVYEPSLLTPKCQSVAASCSSGSLLVGRGPLGPEPHQPNTTHGECTDGPEGTFHFEESVDEIQVSTPDGTPLTAGEVARVDVTVWVGSASDQLDLFSSSAATWPNWTFIGRLTPAMAPTLLGKQVLSTTYTLPGDGDQVIRAVLRFGAWGSAVETCGRGPKDDSDDLWFKAAGPREKRRLRIDMVGRELGAGTVTVTSGAASYACSDPNGCDIDLPSGEPALLTATPAPDSGFLGWSGECSGVEPCRLVMDQARSVSAEFLGPRALLLRAESIEGGQGRILLTPAPLGGAEPSCVVGPSDCGFLYPPATVVHLVAEAAAGSKFVGWSGSACSGLGECELAMPGTAGGSSTQAVTAAFVGPRPLTVRLSSVNGGSGSVTVTPPPAGESVAQCVQPPGAAPVQCVFFYPPDTALSLSAQAQGGSTFEGWSACPGSTACPLQIGSDPVTIDASFSQPSLLSLALYTVGGWGSVTLSPASLDGATSCALLSGNGPQYCSLRYRPGTAVSLTAMAASGSAFQGWTEACSGTGPCQLTLGTPGAAVSGTFAAGPAGGTAVYDPQLKAPACPAGGASCDSGALLVGRAALGPEPKFPNTVGGSCGDGAGGTFHSDESLDRIRVSTLDGSPLAPGKTVRIEVTVWAWAGYSSDKLDLFATGNAQAPAWTLIGTLAPTRAGQQVLTTTYVLPAGPRQALRGQFRYLGGATTACSVGAFDDHDDLAF
jgi:hypothetical protein